jgi:hypothetical protein
MELQDIDSIIFIYKVFVLFMLHIIVKAKLECDTEARPRFPLRPGPSLNLPVLPL